MCVVIIHTYYGSTNGYDSPVYNAYTTGVSIIHGKTRVHAQKGKTKTEQVSNLSPVTWSSSLLAKLDSRQLCSGACTLYSSFRLSSRPRLKSWGWSREHGGREDVSSRDVLDLPFHTLTRLSDSLPAGSSSYNKIVRAQVMLVEWMSDRMLEDQALCPQKKGGLTLPSLFFQRGPEQSSQTSLSCCAGNRGQPGEFSANAWKTLVGSAWGWKVLFLSHKVQP